MGRTISPHQRQLEQRALRSRAGRRQLRKYLGKQRNVEWRLFGSIVRRWAYYRPIPGTTQLEPCSRAGGWIHREAIVPPVKDPARDALNVRIAMNVKTGGHLLGR